MRDELLAKPARRTGGQSGKRGANLRRRNKRRRQARRTFLDSYRAREIRSHESTDETD